MNLDDLADLAEQYRAIDRDVQREVRVCVAASCQSSGAAPVFDALVAGLGDGKPSCKVKGVGCMGLCSAGPLVSIADRTAARGLGHLSRRHPG
jgi:bidirectional [NiFe] hydrogenase diaphorase subunit